MTYPKKLECGVPQGLPVSSILFLYLAEPMESGNFRAHFGYADGIGILEIGHTVAESATRAQNKVDSLLEWARNNAFPFDFQKLVVILLQGRSRKNPVQITINDRDTDSAENFRWLGINLDNQLIFKHHVAT